MTILKFQNFSKQLKKGNILLSAGEDGTTDAFEAFSINYIERQPGQEVRPHTHDRTEIFVFVSGKAIVLAGEQIEEVSAGDVALAPVGSPHAIWVMGPEPLRYYTFNVPPSSKHPMVDAPEEVVRKWKQALGRK